MTDPEYRYVKGEGWVLGAFDTLEFTHAPDQRYRLEARTPKIGENVFVVYDRKLNREWFNEDGSPKLKRFMSFCDVYSRPENAAMAITQEYIDRHTKYAREMGEEPAWVVLVPLG